MRKLNTIRSGVPDAESPIAPKLSGFPKHDNNPFVEEAINQVQIVKRYRSQSGRNRKDMLQLVNVNTGEVEGHTIFVRQIEVDEQQFTKLYLSNFPAFWDLSKAAIRVFGYIMTRLKPKSDMVSFSLKECMAYTKYLSKKPVYEGLAQLVEQGIIARGFSDAIYFINPMVFFNGDRVSYVHTYVKRRQDELEQAREVKDVNQLAMEFA